MIRKIQVIGSWNRVTVYTTQCHGMQDYGDLGDTTDVLIVGIVWYIADFRVRYTGTVLLLESASAT